MSSDLRNMLEQASYSTATKAAHLAAQVLLEGRLVESILRIYPADSSTGELLNAILDAIEVDEGVSLQAMSPEIRWKNVAAIEAALSAITQAAVSYDEDQADELLRKLRKVRIG